DVCVCISLLLIHFLVGLFGLPSLFVSVHLLLAGAVAAGVGVVILLMAFEAAKAGMVGGLAYGAVTAVSESILLLTANDIRSQIQLDLVTGQNVGLTADQLVTLAILIVILASIIGGVIIGAILGLVFSGVNSRFLKGRTILAKALLFGLVLWIINSLINLTGLFDY